MDFTEYFNSAIRVTFCHGVLVEKDFAKV